MRVPAWLLNLKRLSRSLHQSPSGVKRLVAIPLAAVYLAVSRVVFSMDIPVGTEIGAGTTIHHGIGLVVHRDAVVGERCILRQCTTIGERTPNGGAPRVGVGVDVGSNAVILGHISIGDGAVIGAGSVVLRDVPAGQTVVGVPARAIGQS